MDLAPVFSQLLPISSEHFSLEFVPETVDENTGEMLGGVRPQGDGRLIATLRTFLWDVDGGERTIRDIKEQEVVFLFGDEAEDPRAPAFLEGWAAAVRFIFERHEELHRAGELTDAQRQLLADCMPADLVSPGLLRLRRPQTADEFTEALLSSKKRLGHLLP